MCSERDNPCSAAIVYVTLFDQSQRGNSVRHAMFVTVHHAVFVTLCSSSCVRHAVQPIRTRYSNEFTASIGLRPLRAVHHPAPPCTTLHHPAPPCTTLHHPAPPCTTLHHPAPPCTTLHHPAPPCTTLHHPAPPCTTLHHPAPPCTTLKKGLDRYL